MVESLDDDALSRTKLKEHLGVAVCGLERHSAFFCSHRVEEHHVFGGNGQFHPAFISVVLEYGNEIVMAVIVGTADEAETKIAHFFRENAAQGYGGSIVTAGYYPSPVIL